MPTHKTNKVYNYVIILLVVLIFVVLFFLIRSYYFSNNDNNNFSGSNNNSVNLVLEHENIYLNVGENQKLGIKVYNGDYANLVYLSVDSSIARVDNNGYVYALKDGVTEIRVIYNLGEGSLEKKCVVNVGGV